MDTGSAQAAGTRLTVWGCNTSAYCTATGNALWMKQNSMHWAVLVYKLLLPDYLAARLCARPLLGQEKRGCVA